MSETRARIRRRIEREPGIHFRALTRGLELATGQVQYHLGRLDDITEERVNGRTHYYPPGYDEWERTALALLRRETARDIVAELYDADEARPDAVADRVGVARSTLEYHLDGLVAGGVVRKDRDGNRVTLSLVRPGETVALLGTVEPSLAERLTDRFERLVDSLLEPPERD
ncbi:winged helix-turn-helix transcriptional regulator [Haloarcula onubensis]|uniref:ArsR family transcriptional regulator n=1 Tax=Haloarcula onubensis TaxID=2950539 RepID=A0ABU2FLK0_9EURY|nr:ArsR family transcriptional regulator [Halomicroarcula sp. S3CR25-11]MDS0281186.1 ArsR family transcriptional regulator [Halomicroarcula sp. S3CR25-11]